MVIITKPPSKELTRAKGTVNITSAGRRRDKQGNWIYSIQSSDPRRQITDPYYTRVNAHTGEAIDCTCNDFLIWRVPDNCKHMDFASADCKAKLLDALQKRIDAVWKLLSQIEEHLNEYAFGYPGPFTIEDLSPEREHLLSTVEQMRAELRSSS